MADTFDLGDRVISSIGWTLDGAATDDAAVVIFYYRTPDGAVEERTYAGPEDPDIEKTGVGAYETPINLNDAGRCAHRWRAWLDSGQELNLAAEWETFYVKPW